MLNQEVYRPQYVGLYWNDGGTINVEQAYSRYLRDITTTEYGAKLVKSMIEKSGQEEIKAIEKAERNISASIEASAHNVNSKIEAATKDITNVIKSEFSYLDQRMASINQGIININLSLKSIQDLLRIPDSEKQRQRHIELGIKFSYQAIVDSDLAIDAKLEFESALQLMTQDWFVLQQLGMLYLFNVQCMNIEKAKEYFIKAAKYGSVDSGMNEESIINQNFKENLSIPFFEKCNQENSSMSTLNDFITECHLNTALASYILNQFEEAVIYARKAVGTSFNSAKSLFLLSKYLVRAGDLSAAVIYANKAMKKAPYLVEAVMLEKDLQSIMQDLLPTIEKITLPIPSRLNLINSRIKIINNKITNPEISRLLGELNISLSVSKFFNLLRQPILDNDLKANLNISNFILFKDSAHLIVNSQSGSTSLLQRKMKLDYDLAGKIMNQLEATGIVSPLLERGMRDVLISTEQELELLLADIVYWNMTIEDLELIGDSFEIDEMRKKEVKIEATNEILRQLMSELDLAKIQLDTLGEFQLFRSAIVKEEQINSQIKIINALASQIENKKIMLLNIENENKE